MSHKYKLEWAAFFIIFTLLLWVTKPDTSTPHIYTGDDERYISYSVALYNHGIFGLSIKDTEKVPPHGNANAPLYSAFMTGIMFLDPKLASSFECLIEKGTNADCPEKFDSLFAAQICLAVLTLFFIYLTAFYYTQRKSVAWIACFLAVASGIFQEFSFSIMTEILLLPAFAALCLFCLLFYQSQKLRWVIASALTLGILTLIRPSYLYLFYGFVLFFAVLWAIRRNKQSFLNLAVLILAFIVSVSPWAIRNKIHFDSLALTTGGYAEAILIQRTNYNQMSWLEVGVSMIYWLPDFGDGLAEKLFPEELHNKLGWGEGTYYDQQYQDKIAQLESQLGDKDKILGHIIKTEILTAKHVATSIPLAMRGVFIAKYWGLIGFIAFLFLLVQTARKKEYGVLVISLPLFFMVAFHAGVSVSIPRYNLPLIMLYALCMAWYMDLYGRKLFEKIKSR